VRPIRRIVDCGPAAVNDTGPNGGAAQADRNYQDYQYVDGRHGQTSSFFSATGTTWVRFWAEWPIFQPFSDVVLGQSYPEGNPPLNSAEWKRLRAWRALQALDRQINAARADGRRVMLTLFRCPPWANGTQTFADARDSGNPVPDIEHFPQDRLKREDFDRWKDSNSVKEQRTHSFVASRRQLEYKWPDDLDSDSPWARWFNFMYDRYRPGRLGHERCVNVLEFINEPNGQMWPKMAQDPVDVWAPENPNYGCAVAQLMQTAAFISSWYNYELTLAAPATSDEPTDRGYPRMWTPCDEFQNQVLATCAQIGFAAPTRFVWTHHNYKDVEEQRTSTDTSQTATVNLAYRSRRALRGKWTGYAEGAGPMLFITEGGYPLEKASGTNAQKEETQRARIAQFGSLLNSTDAVAGNIGMMSNYFFYSTPENVTSGSSGLRWYPGQADPYDGDARPAQGAWGAVNPVDSALNDWFWWTGLGGNSGYDLASISLRPGHREVFMIDQADLRLKHKWEEGGPFVSSWYDLGGFCTSPPSAYCRPGSGRTDIAVRGWDWGVYLKHFQDGWGWAGDWESIGMPPGGSAGGVAIMSTHAGARNVFARSASDNNIYERWQPSGGGWSGWGSHGAPPGGAISDPACCSWSSGRQDVFVIGADGACWWRYGWNGWSGWTSLGGDCQSSPEVCTFGPGRLSLFVRGPGWGIYRRNFEGLTDGNGGLVEGRWGPWERVVVAQGTQTPGDFASSPAVCAQGNRIDLFVRFSNNTINHNWWGH
jgi:hypothetical protein